jgi:hypothetical protein
MPPLYNSGTTPNFSSVVAWVADFASILVPVIIGLAFIFVMWRVIKAWIIQGGTEEGVQAGKTAVVVGIIGLTVMVGMWGIISLVRNAVFF